MEQFDIYRDIASRTDGDVYIGVVGPVRTGKSTFIKRFMETMVLPNIIDQNKLSRARDEMPQSGDGKTIMTTQPHFVPNEAVRVRLGEGVEVNLRMIDCVGYVVDGAMGHVENGKPRMVRTPWSGEEMPFREAAELGTRRVMNEHSTIGIVMTTDGSISGLERGEYLTAEERVIEEMKLSAKPFVILLNTTSPHSEETEGLRRALQSRYGVTVKAVDVMHVSEEDIVDILATVLYEFPVRTIEADLPKWMRVLPRGHRLITEIIDGLTGVTGAVKMSSYESFGELYSDSEYLETPNVEAILGEGRIVCHITTKSNVFYRVLSEECGAEVGDDYKLMSYVKRMRANEERYDKLREALEQVDREGYGVVMPTMEEMTLEEPVMVKQGGRFGVKLRASAPSLHVMRVDVETEVSPIVGTEQQGEDMVKYLVSEFESDPQNIWNTNIFGKSLNMLVREGLNTKLTSIPQDARVKLRRTLSRIVNESKGGVICILL